MGNPVHETAQIVSIGLANNASHAPPTGYTAAQAVFPATATAILVGDHALSDRLLVAVLFAVTMLVSALPLFLVKPMFAKMLLPLLGGSPAVWNTAMVFYQTALLAGYAYAHASTSWLGPRRQAVLQLCLLPLPLLVLPIAIAQGAAPQQVPIRHRGCCS